MKKTFLSFALLTLLCGSVSAQVSNVNPRPQTVKTDGKLFPAPKQWKISTSYALAKSYAVDALDELGVARAKGGRADYRITLGVVGEKGMAKYEKLVPSHAEGYYLSVEPKGAVVVGRDERGLYYGVQTLREMMAKGQMEICTVQDWPDVAYRGAIEGFYGRPWSHEHRLRQLDFYGHNKLNVYIYGPKETPIIANIGATPILRKRPINCANWWTAPTLAESISTGPYIPAETFVGRRKTATIW